ncbi:hypothetical protein BC832DRAFT_529725 [Gaertneriomyces semiglobifer]|nr:hypothetical protein BC832DRAFT_529725 [Gaertneriomyces semiglobifer]
MSAAEHSDERRLEIAENLAGIRERVSQAQSRRGVGKDVRLVAVSKTKPVDDLRCAYDHGQRHFGENVQELVEKAPQLPKDIQWHFIGTLQSNKCKLLAAIPNLWAVETIDSIKKADALNKACEGRSEALRVFAQVNTSGEESKSGIAPDECTSLAEHVVTRCNNLKLQGLMTIGMAHREVDQENPDFKCLRECKNNVDQRLGLDVELSMGMSDDFENAIEAGSTSVRVGSSIFGKRNYNKA